MSFFIQLIDIFMRFFILLIIISMSFFIQLIDILCFFLSCSQIFYVFFSPAHRHFMSFFLSNSYVDIFMRFFLSSKKTYFLYLYINIFEQEKQFSYSIKIERNMIVVTGFLLIMNQMQIHLARNQKEKLSPRSGSFQFEMIQKTISQSAHRN